MPGRAVVVDHTLSPEADPLVNRCFELAEFDEVMDLTTVVMVHEEIQVTRTRSIHRKVVGATIRREVAEVTEATGRDATS